MSSVQPLDHYLQAYGDLLFDLCNSLLWDSQDATPIFQSILKEINRTRKDNAFSVHERAWVLRVALTHLVSAFNKQGRTLSASEQMELDSAQSLPNRLAKFSHFFKRLGPEDQLLLLLRDKYGLPYSEIAAAMEMPEASLKLRRQQSLSAMEEWIWGQA